MTTGPDRLLAEARSAALAGPPTDALAPTAALLGADVSTDVRARARWLRGVALGALGRYGEGLDTLTPLLEPVATPPRGELVVPAALASATAASLLRQIGDHPAAEPLDGRGLELLAGLPEDGQSDAEVRQARQDCAVGHTADAVGLRELDTARNRLEAARSTVDDDPDPGWRAEVRLAWVETEVALLALDVPAALSASELAVLLATARRAPRHVTKSEMFFGVAQALDGDLGIAHGTLVRAAGRAERFDLLPLIWPIRAVLATMPGLSADVSEAAGHLAGARAAAEQIAAAMPRVRVERWVARDPMAAFLLSS